MKQETSPSVVVSETNSSDASNSSTEENVQRHWQGVVKRRSFLKGLGIAGATLSAGALLGAKGNAQATQSSGKLSKGDVALLKFAAAVELIEADLWQQYNELGRSARGQSSPHRRPEQPRWRYAPIRRG